MKRPDQVLAQGVIDADLAADRAVDLCKQCRRHVNERNPAQECGGSEPRRVADHTAADGDDRASAIGVGADERLVDLRDRLQVLEALAVGKQDRVAATECALQLLAVEVPDDGTRDDEAPRSDRRDDRAGTSRSWLRPSPIQIGEVRLPVVTSMRMGAVKSGSRLLAVGSRSSRLLMFRLEPSPKPSSPEPEAPELIG